MNFLAAILPGEIDEGEAQDQYGGEAGDELEEGLVERVDHYYFSLFSDSRVAGPTDPACGSLREA